MTTSHIKGQICSSWIKEEIGKKKKKKTKQGHCLQSYKYMLFYWIIFQNKTSPFNSYRSYCRNVHRSDGKHEDRVNRGLFSVDTKREGVISNAPKNSDICMLYKKKINKQKHPCHSRQWAVISAGCWLPLEPANPDYTFVSLLSFPPLSAGVWFNIAYCMVFPPACCFPKWLEKPMCSCCLLWLLLQGVQHVSKSLVTLGMCLRV